MDRSNASEYVYAKASGMLAKSFIGPRASTLFSVNSLSELWSLLFKSDVPAIPGELLAKKLEQEAEKRFITQYVRLVSCFSTPDHILVSLLRFYDFDNLKDIGASLSLKKEKMPEIADISPYSMLNYDGWPNLEAITARTPLEWYKTAPTVSDQQKIDAKVDNQYISMIFGSIDELPSGERAPVFELIKLRYVLENILWAIRLKVYYKMEKNDIIPLLAYAGLHKGKMDIIAGPAIRILDKSIDSWDEWTSWKYASMLNPHEEGTIWNLDPRWFELSIRKRVNYEAMKRFHMHPFTALVMVSWYMIKLNELHMIRTATEALRLDADKREAMRFAGVSPAAVR